jgi:extradiol dioxygenase family protein
MLKNSPFYAGFAVNDIDVARRFYAETLGVAVDVLEMGLLNIRAANGYSVLIYPKPTHEPAAHTILNFPVEDIEAAVDRLHGRGVRFEHYDMDVIKTNAKGIAFSGEDRPAGVPRGQAWFKDPAGNILSLIEN